MKALIPLALFAAAFAVRALPFRDVFRPERIYLHGSDSYYHMRRVVYGLANFPRNLDFDPYIYFPEGARAIWPPLFDALVSLLLLPLGGGDERTLEAAAVWIPPALGAVTVVVVYATARRHFGPQIGVVAAAILSVLSAHFWYSQVGYLDHHVAVAAMTALLLAGTLNVLTLHDSHESTPASRVGAGLALGCCVAMMFLLWPGGLLHVALCELCLCAFLLGRRDARDARTFAAHLALIHAVALALLLAFGAPRPWAQWGAYSPVVLTRFQPWLLALLTLFGLACRGLFALPAASDGRGARIALALACCAGLAGASLLLIPELAASAGDAWQWLAKREAFQAGVRESQPLFRQAGRFDPTIAQVRLSLFIYVFPLALIALLREARDPARRIPALTLVAWALPLALVTLGNRRFFNSWSIPFAMVFAWSLVRLFDAISTRMRLARGGRIAAGVGLTAVTVLLLVPMWPAYAPYLGGELSVVGSDRPPHRWQPLVETAGWLRDHTPETRGYLDASERPAYGVLASVGVGHVVQYAGRRPAVVDNFGDDVGPANMPLAQHYFGISDEEEAARVLERLSVRYVISEAGWPAGESMMQRLFNHDGSGLARHRMIYESPRVARSNIPKAFKVFERVAGAPVSGRAPAGARVAARLEYETNRGRRAVYRTHTTSDANGHYELRLPLANEPPAPGFSMSASWQIESADERAPLVITNRAVRSGAHIEGPDFPLGAPDA